MRSALIAREGGWPYLLGVYCVATNPCDIFINERLVDHLRTCNAFDGRLYSLLGVEKRKKAIFQTAGKTVWCAMIGSGWCACSFASF
ncbi:MAG: hypothetical protein CME76_08095 [Halomonas sp.]|jgi:hypothetical protein|nr:hypothetical protein [Halomonas sp.]